MEKQKIDEKDFVALLSKYTTPKFQKINEEFARLREENKGLKAQISALEKEIKGTSSDAIMQDFMNRVYKKK